MSTWRDTLWRFWPWKKRQGENQCLLKDNENKSCRLDQYAIIIENVLIWENPFVSATCVLFVNLLFWTIFSLERKFYFLLSLILWPVLFYDFWNEYLFPYLKVRWTAVARIGEWYNQHCSAQSVTEYGRYYVQMRAYFVNFYSWLVNFRKDYPGLFCIWMFVFFVCLAALGQAIPGLLMAYIVSMVILVGPGIAIHLLPSSFVQRVTTIHQYLVPTGSGGNDSEVEEYLLEPSKETLAVLSQATDLSESSAEGGIDEGLEALLPENDNNHTVNGDSSSHVSYFDLDLDVSKMPSHDQESLEGSLDAPEEFELSPYEVDGVINSEHLRKRNPVPSSQKDRRQSVEKEQGSRRSSADDDSGIKFENMHFEGGESSEEEEIKNFTEGLSLERVPQEDRSGLGSEMAGRMGNLLGELLVRTGAVAAMARGMGNMGGLVPSTQGSTNRRRDRGDEDLDSDEDFEMISEEDLS
ncbi:hypothetical protein J437_LFUL010224 [Ladona fulva]|uniref:RETREG1-3/ARL6IP-like N-terminal reticulon-homology domain-containing protein n=1 Tax=Ladona fulva TaxID=123851 RepID=A0A8K0P2P2_LADFU|nr:hypothetical protein J437_LFUL010224 [Ladona fulva]